MDDFFPILPWDAQHGWRCDRRKLKEGLPSIAQCNFTMAGFVRPEDLRLCEELGLKAIIFDGCKGATTKNWILPDEEIDRRIREVVERSGDSEAILGYFIGDEPGASEFPYLAKAVQAVKRYAPGKIGYINLYPNYATLGAKDISQLQTDTYKEYLERFMGEVEPQLLSYDNYMVQISDDLENPDKAASYYTNLLTVRDIALRYKVPFWNIVSSNRIRPWTTIPSPANMFFQAYTTLAAGGNGVTWFTYYSRVYGYAPIDEKLDCKTPTWYYLQEVNRQVKILGPIMNRLNSTGVYFTSPAPVESLPVLPSKLIGTVDSNTPLMIGEFKSRDGSDYVMVVNLSLKKSGRFTLHPKISINNMEIVSCVDGQLYPINDSIQVVAGQGALIKLSGSIGAVLI